MTDFLLFDSTAPIRRPSTAKFYNNGNHSASDFLDSMYYSGSNGNNGFDQTGSGMLPRRESNAYSLPASLSSTPIASPSFLQSYFSQGSNEMPNSKDITSANLPIGVPALSPSPVISSHTTSNGYGSEYPQLSNMSQGSDYSFDQSGAGSEGDDDSEFLSDDDNHLSSNVNHFRDEYLLLTSDSADFQNMALFRNQKLERTISDVLEDELYTPTMSPAQSAVSDDFVADLSDTLSMGWGGVKSMPTTRHASPCSFRDSSPFRKSSPFYPGLRAEASGLSHSHSYQDLIADNRTQLSHSARSPHRRRFEQSMRRADLPSSNNPKTAYSQNKVSPIQQKLVQQQLQQQQLRSQNHQSLQPSAAAPNLCGGNPSAKTISPKEALLDYNEEPNQQHEHGDLFNATITPSSSESSNVTVKTEESPEYDSDEDMLNADYGTSSMNHPNYSSQLPDMEQRGRQMYSMLDQSFISPRSSAFSSPHASDYEDYSSSAAVSPATAGSVYAVSSSDPSLNIFVCNECGIRFPKAHNLHLHKRTHNVTPPRKKLPLSAHVGPHRCSWISPTTGKVCNKVFSRPYDLIRHQDTIHASNRKTFKCELCGDETKTFSRQDALARHIRVKHEKGK